MMDRSTETQPAPRTSTDIRQFIVRVNNGLQPKLAAQIVDLFGESDLYRTSQVGRDETAPTIRSSMQLNVPKVAMHIGTGPARGVARKLSNAVHDWMDAYRCATSGAVTLSRFCAPNLIRYEPGSFFTTHTDAKAGSTRTVSAIALLPSEFTGGQLRFFDDDEPYPLDPGDVVLFPSNFMFPHSVSEILGGQRYSIVTWMF